MFRKSEFYLLDGMVGHLQEQSKIQAFLYSIFAGSVGLLSLSPDDFGHLVQLALPHRPECCRMPLAAGAETNLSSVGIGSADMTQTSN